MKEKTKKKGPKPKKKNSVYPCQYCSKTFENTTNWHAHIKLHTTEKPYQCELCDYKCKIKKYLTRHVNKTHNKPTAHPCPTCGKCFHYDCALRAHMRVHTGEKPYKCNECDKAFSSSYSLNGHKLIHTGQKPFACQYCEYACRDSSTIRKHMERHLGISKDYPCSICNKNFKKKVTLQIHVDEVHFDLDTRKYPCEHCDKMFKTKPTLRLHVASVHRKSNRIKCEICGLVTTKNNIQKHMKRHIDVRPYRCSYKPCGKRFKDMGDLKRHQVIHYPEYHFVCNVCNRRFPRKFRLKKHMRNGCQRVQCHHCGQLFTAKIFLVQHIKNAHGPYPKSREYLCDVCEMVTYSRRGIIQHLKYGHGTEKDTKCQICRKDYFKCLTLKEHYLSTHNIIYTLMDEKKEISIKEEPLEEIEEVPLEEIEEVADPADFIYEVEILKHEVDETPTEPSPVQLQPPSPEHFTIDSDTITYSKKVLSEDITQSLIDRAAESDVFHDFFIGYVLKKPEEKTEVQELPKQIVDEEKEKRVEKRLKKLLTTVRIRNQWMVLEKLRKQYNRRIKMATSGGEKKEQKTIRYFKKPENNNESTNTQNNINNDKGSNINDDEINEQEKDDLNKRNIDPENENGEKNIHNDENGEDRINDDEINNQDNDNLNKQKVDPENKNGEKNIHNDENGEDRINDDEINNQVNDDSNKRKIGPTKENGEEISHNDENGENRISDEEIGDDDEAIKDDDKKDIDYRESDLESNSDEELHMDGKLKFNTHQCYICFKLFKTKTDLKFHCKEHFAICNEKMLKKCPFCGYVTNLTMSRHLKLVHNVSINIPYARIKEKETETGSKYVFEIDKDCDLEIIPSISNLNKIASMKIDEKNRASKNTFLGKTKLVKKGGSWMVQKEKVDVNTEYLLPEFSKEEYLALKTIGDDYLEQLRNLSILAKKKGTKILYPCEGCDKICLTMAALKLHNRKHEINPKKFKPKVWKNKILNGIGGKYRHVNKVKSKRKRCRNDKQKNNNSVVTNQAASKNVKKSRLLEKFVNKKEDSTPEVANRFADPNPVKNNHNCDRELIDFYYKNIKGGDIEFWQFLKIFNKMGRENVNDFKDLEKRIDFGIHTIIDNDTNKDENTKESNKPDIEEKTKAKPKKVLRNKKKAFTRVIMISKKEYLRRLEIKNQMRQRVGQLSK